MKNPRDNEVKVRMRGPLLAAACALMMYAGCSFPEYGFVPDGPAGTGGEGGVSGSAGSAGSAGATGGTGGTLTGGTGGSTGGSAGASGTGGTSTGGTGGTSTGGTGGTSTGGTGGTSTGGTGGTSTGGTGGTSTGGTGGTSTGGTGGTVDAGPPPDGLVIAEVYGAGGNAGALFTHDYVVLFNRGTQPAGLDGLVLQYASVTGAFGSQYITLPAVTVQPGQYFLVQLSPGTTGAGSPLPAPDFSAFLALGGERGKVALVPVASILDGCGEAATPCSLTDVIDFVGYGTTSSQYEGGSPTANLSAAKAAIRKAGGCVDTDENGEDFLTDTPTPRNTQTSFTFCS